MSANEVLVDHIAALEKERDDLKRRLGALEEDVQEYDDLLTLQHSRTRGADLLWQKAHNKPGVLPDLGELVEWLLFKANLAEEARILTFSPDQKAE